MRGEGDAPEEKITSTAQQYEFNKSCDRCGLKKRRCDGENPCRRCTRLGQACTYSKRRPRARKPGPPGSVPDGSASNPSIDAPATLQGRRGESTAPQHSGRVLLKRTPVRDRRCTRLGETRTYNTRRLLENWPLTPRPVSMGSASDPSIHIPSQLRPGRVTSAALQHHGKVSLKRCRLSPSPATGLVGMQENMFLSDYFGCVGFIRFTSQSNIRETMVNMFTRSVAVQHSDSSDYSTTDQHFDTIMPADSELPVGPSTCVFWCAVAIGALVKGRPINTVEKYSRLAREAVANFKGPANAEVGRAWAMLAFMNDFCGDLDNFHEFTKCANAILCEVQEKENETLPEGISNLIKNGETVRIHVGNVNMEEVESFCKQERPIPQITQAATEDEICTFVMNSFRSFEQATYQNVLQHRHTAPSLGIDGEPSADIALADPVADDFLKGSNPHFIASLVREQQAESGSSGIMGKMIAMLREHSRQFEQIELAAARPSIREGIGGIMVNSTLAIERVAKKDISGALGNLESCGEVFQRYPGLCRFSMGAHNAHVLLANLAVIDGPRARAVYAKIMTAYNSAPLPGTPAIPPFEEWQGVAACCDNYNCRLMGFMLNMEHGGASSPASPQERAVEMQENEPCDAPVHCRQPRGVPSATGSGTGAEGSSVFDARHTHKIVDALRSNVGCMEYVPVDRRRTAMTQPQEPTLTASVFQEVVFSGPIVDSEVNRTVYGQSNHDGLTELGPQAAQEALLLSELSRGRAAIGETEDEVIGVEDWLDVTHAMLDTSGPGLL